MKEEQTLSTRFEQFIKQRRFITNVSPHTVAWYRHSLHWLPSESPTQEDLTAVILRMRERGLKPTGVNCVGRAINSYLHWSSGTERKCGAGCTHPIFPRMKEPTLILPTFTSEQVKLLMKWKPKTKLQKRIHLLTLILLDTGCRISEATGLHVRDVDLDNLLATLDGKGSKQRIVPISFELRKAIFRYIAEFNRDPDSLLLVSTNGTRLTNNIVHQSMRLHCRRLGFEPPVRTLHAFRHTFALNYLRKGGSVFHLQKVLGHTTLDMTRRYSNLTTTDLQAVHQRLSLLSGM